MQARLFEWDQAKASANLEKHRVSFEEASTAFEDPNALVELDEGHSDEELRETLIGFSGRSRVLLVVFTERREMTRIISARKASAAERRRYESQFE